MSDHRPSGSYFIFKKYKTMLRKFIFVQFIMRQLIVRVLLDYCCSFNNIPKLRVYILYK